MVVYPNMSRQDYHIQGWKKNKIKYILILLLLIKARQRKKITTPYLFWRQKALDLKNEDTKYKQDVFTLCNELGAKKAWKELFEEFPDHDFEFQVVFEDEWQNKINAMMQ